MAAYLGKYHIGFDGKGYIVSQSGGRRMYDKKLAPSFVNKFGGGEASYRDSSIWQFFVQTNFRNGSKQLKFDDPGKFWKSENVDTTQLEQLTLQRKLVSVGQIASNVRVKSMEVWRSSTSWWNANYGYRQQLTITAPTGKQVPQGYPMKIAIDTAALQTAVKVRSDRNDWRVLYFNGSSWVDLTRDYVSTTSTFFALQAAIAAGGSDSNYYVYYGYSSESTSKQPSSEADYNAVYAMYGTTPDSNSKAVWHFREGSGTSINDDGTGSNTLTLAGSQTWATDGQMGRYITQGGASTSDHQTASGTDFDLNSLTIEGWFYFPAIKQYNDLFFRRYSGGSEEQAAYGLYYYATDGKFHFETRNSGGVVDDLSASFSLSANTWYHIAAVYDGTSTKRIYVNNIEIGSKVWTDGIVAQTGNFYLGSNDRSAAGGTRNSNVRIQHVRVSNAARTSFSYALSSTDQPSLTNGTEITTQPPSSSFDLYAGGSDGKVYKWDGTTAWTEQFNARYLVWFESGIDDSRYIGDSGGTEYAAAQSFQVTTACTLSQVMVYLKKNTGTPGNVTVRIETDSASKPSGTLVNASATATITAFTDTSFVWKTATLAADVALSASTTYWIVVKTAAGPNDNQYVWGRDSTSPTYSNGNGASSSDGGTTWTAQVGEDFYFRLLGPETEVNTMLLTQVGGTQRLYVGTGKPTSITNGEARLYQFDGTTWAANKTFATATESCVLSMAESSVDSKVYVGIGPQARIYSTADMSAYTLSKRITVPQNPGYPFALKEYNSFMYAGGGSPEFLPTKYYNGFLYYYDTTKWQQLYPFDFTIVRSLEFYDAYLFVGTYRGDVYVYDTSSLNPIYNFKDLYDYKVEVSAMKYHDDKLYIATRPQDGYTETNVGIYLFDRRGISLAHTAAGITGYSCFSVANGSLFVGTDNGYVYKVDTSQYAETGFVQSSYFDANLPSINKLYSSVTVKHDPLGSGHSIQVYYRFDESESWTYLGVSNVVGAKEATLSFASGTYSKKISLKVILNTSDPTTTPKLTELVMQYAIKTLRKWQWSIRILAIDDLVLLDKTEESRPATTIRSDVETLLSNVQLVSFTDIDGTAYNVLLTDIDTTSWVVNQDTVNENEIVLTMIEA